MADADLPPDLDLLVREARTATLATMRPDGHPRLVPICFVVAPGPLGPGALLYSPLDEKPKRTRDPHHLARVRDVLARPRLELLVDRWDEDWHRLAWVRLDGPASLLEPTDGSARIDEHGRAIEALRDKYDQYRDQALEDRPLLRIEVERVSWWRGSER